MLSSNTRKKNSKTQNQNLSTKNKQTNKKMIKTKITKRKNFISHYKHTTTTKKLSKSDKHLKIQKKNTFQGHDNRYQNKNNESHENRYHNKNNESNENRYQNKNNDSQKYSTQKNYKNQNKQNYNQQSKNEIYNNKFDSQNNFNNPNQQDFQNQNYTQPNFRMSPIMMNMGMNYNNVNNFNNYNFNYVQQKNVIPFQYQQFYGNPQQVQQESMNLNQQVDSSDKAVLDTLDYYFSEGNLNKARYMRQRMTSEGYINATEIASFNKMKAMSATPERISSLLDTPDICSVEKRTTLEGVVLLRNKNWDKLSLIPLDMFKDQKPRNDVQFMEQQNYNNLYAFYNNQNQSQNPMNSFIPNNQNYPMMQGYNQNNFMQENNMVDQNLMQQYYQENRY